MSKPSTPPLRRPSRPAVIEMLEGRRLMCSDLGFDAAHAPTSSAPLVAAASQTSPLAASVVAGTSMASNDVGNVGKSGSTSLSNGVYTVAGSGADIWGGSDAFRFVHRQLTGDGTVVARVTSQQNTHPWAKAGVMIRESLATNSKFAMTVVSPSNGTFASHRTSTGASATNGGSSSYGLPLWVRLTRTGNVIQSFKSNDGTNWTSTGSRTISMNSTVYVGLAVTSHKAGTLSTAKFDNVRVTTPALRWTTVAGAPLAKYEHAGLAVGGKLYSLGGFYNTAIEATTKSEVYDPRTNRWTAIRDLPEPVTHAGQATDGRYIYLVGGFIGKHPGPMTNHVWRYDTAYNTYTALPNLPILVGSGASAIVGRTLYFFGGTIREGNTYKSDSNKTFALNLDNLSAGWQTKANLPVARNHLGGIALGGLVYAVGGQKLGSELGGNVNTVNVYNPATNVWSTVAGLPTLLGHVVSSTFVQNGRIRVIGGVTQNSLEMDTVFEYNPVANVWSSLTKLPGRRQSPLADVIDGVMYVSGGYEPGTVYTTTWKGN